MMTTMKDFAVEEAENERMHLLTFTEMRNPGLFMRSMVLLGQGVFFNLYFVCYLLAPRTCHRFVGYLEEEAVRTYTKAVEHIDDGRLATWKEQPAPEIAIKYWRLPADAKMKDLLLAVRADEAIHRYVCMYTSSSSSFATFSISHMGRCFNAGT